MSELCFQARSAECRLVAIPPELDADARARFVTKISAAVRQQAELARSCDSILALREQIAERGEYLVLSHEPASPLDVARLESEKQRPELALLSWVTRGGLGALKAAAGKMVPHGGLGPGCVLLDRFGRVRITDFGIAPAYEAVCGSEVRRQIHLECGTEIELPAGVDAAGSVSGLWSLQKDESSQERGWIAPLLAHELLQGGGRLNPKADQFALGVTLFLLATGHHPYGAEFSDPTLMFYFHLEPYSLRDERRDWEEVFERAEKGAFLEADRGLIAWSELIKRLLAADAAQRFSNLAEAEGLLAASMPESWARVAAALAEGEKLLAEGDAGGFLERVGPYRGEESLPSQWRTRLDAWIEKVEAEKELIARRHELRQRLREAQEALDNVDVEEAKRLATEVSEAEESEADVRAAARELLQLCEDQEQIGRREASEWAQAYLEAVRDSIAAGELAEARAVLQGLLGDPALPANRAAQARQMLTEIELAEQRRERLAAEVVTAQEETAGGHYDAAQQRLEAVLAADDLVPALRELAEAALENVAGRQKARAACLALIAEADAAWEAAEVEKVDAALGRLPTETDDPQVAAATAKLQKRAESLRAARQHEAAAVAALEAHRPEAALERARQARRAGDLPAGLAATLAELEKRCEGALGHVQHLAEAQRELGEGQYDAARERLRAILSEEDLVESIATQARLLLEEVESRAAEQRELSEQIERGHKAWQAGDAEALAQVVAAVTPARADAQRAAQRSELLERAAGLRAAVALEAQAGRKLAEGEPDGALAAAREAAGQGALPAVVRERLAELVTRCEAAIAARREAALAAGRERLKLAAAAVDAGQFAEARKEAQAALEAARPVSDEIRADVERVLALCESSERALRASEAALRRLKTDDFAGARAELAGLSLENLPEIVTRQCVQLRATIDEREKAHAEQERARLEAELTKAEQRLAAGKLDEADELAGGIERSPLVDKALRGRLDQLRAAIRAQRPIAAALREVAEKLKAAPAPAAEELAGRLDSLPGELPAWAREQCEALRAKVAELAARQRAAAITAAKAALDRATGLLEAGDVAAGREGLNEAQPAAGLDEAIGRRITELAGLADALARWLPRVEALEARAGQADLLSVQAEVGEARRTGDVPALAAKRLAALDEKLTESIRARREELDAELGRVEQELAGQRPRLGRLKRALEDLVADTVVTEAQRERAAGLQARIEALRQRRPKVSPLAVSGGIVGVAIVAVVIVMMRSGSGGAPVPPKPEPEPNVTPGPGPVVVEPKPPPVVAFAEMTDPAAKSAGVEMLELVAAAQQRLSQQLAHRRAAVGATDGGFVLLLEPFDEAHVAIRAVPAAGGEAGMLAERVELSQLAAWSLPEEWLGRVYPLPTEPQAVEPVAWSPALSRDVAAFLDELVAELGGSAGGPEARQFALRAEGGGEFELLLTTAGRTEPLRVSGLKFDGRGSRPDAAEVKRIARAIREQLSRRE